MKNEEPKFTLIDLIHRGKPQPWVEGDNIPWNDPDFSCRMLKEHLSQDHDALSLKIVALPMLSSIPR
jgi:hypothetical protein